MRPTRIVLCLGVAAGTVTAAGGARAPNELASVPWPAVAAAADSPRVSPNDNRAPAGRLQAGVLTMRLVARPGLWRPEGEQGPEVTVFAFAEEGGVPRIPGPLIRVPAGTEVRASLLNALPKPLRLFGFQDRPGVTLDTIELMPNEVKELRFHARAPGTYLYWARTLPDTFAHGIFEDSQLSGAIVVDSAGARPASDRVFVVGLFQSRPTRRGTPVEERSEVLVFNGLAWPNTERLSYTVGDTVRWRLINASRRLHPLHLTRGEPTAITVLNRAREPVAIHWHGIELESYFDGVGDWSGDEHRIAPAIAPGDSFVVHMTPPRSGTFIYHTHQDEVRQFGGGLVAPLLVLEPGQKRDTLQDRVFLMSSGGPRANDPPFLNGQIVPDTIDLRAGTTYRLRFISIAANDVKAIKLLADTTVQRWRAIAKDGADLPPNQATDRGAAVMMGTGETWDFEYTPPPAARELTLEILSLGRVGLPPVTTRVPVRVRGSQDRSR